MLNKSNAHELAQIAKETGALVFRGPLRYPGLVGSASPLQGDANPKTGDWEIGSKNIPDVLYELRDHQVLLILAPVDGGDPVHLCGLWLYRQNLRQGGLDLLSNNRLMVEDPDG